MPGAKQHRRENHSHRRAARPCHKLALQVPAENGLFANAGRDGERDPKDRFEQGLRSKSARGLGHSRRMNKPGNDAENDDCGDPKSESNGDIDGKIGCTFPAIACDVSDGFSAAAQTPVDVRDENPFPRNSRGVEEQPIWNACRALAMDGEVSNDRNGGKDEK